MSRKCMNKLIKLTKHHQFFKQHTDGAIDEGRLKKLVVISHFMKLHLQTFKKNTFLISLRSMFNMLFYQFSSKSLQFIITLYSNSNHLLIRKTIEQVMLRRKLIILKFKITIILYFIFE